MSPGGYSIADGDDTVRCVFGSYGIGHLYATGNSSPFCSSPTVYAGDCPQ